MLGPTLAGRRHRQTGELLDLGVQLGVFGHLHLLKSAQAPGSPASGKARKKPGTRPSVAWKRSLISADRKRMVCEYEAADAETMRRIQREAGAQFDRVWVGDVIA